MTTYSIITRNLTSKDELEDFLKTFSNIEKSENSYGEWGVLGEHIFIPVDMFTIEESYFVDPILIKQILDISNDPLVVNVYRPNNLDEPILQIDISYCNEIWWIC